MPADDAGDPPVVRCPLCRCVGGADSARVRLPHHLVDGGSCVNDATSFEERSGLQTTSKPALCEARRDTVRL